MHMCVHVMRLICAVPGGATVSASPMARTHHLAAFLFFQLPPSPSCPPGHMGAVGSFTSHHFLWLTVGADQGAMRV